MFGYFKFYKKYSNKLICRCYKNYYCGLCFSLEKNYGQLSRLLLSYDVTLLAIVSNSHKNPTVKKPKCIGDNTKKISFSNENWKKIAAIDILLAAENIEDDIHDEHSVKAIVAKTIFQKPISLAKKDYPEIYEEIKAGYSKIQKLENENASLYIIANEFSDLMTGVLIKSFQVSQLKIEYVAYISKWLYFIDALDDIDDDIRKNRFSPFKVYHSHKILVEQNYMVIDEFLSTINKQHLEKIYKGFSDSYEDIILKSFLENTIPLTTERILTK